MPDTQPPEIRAIQDALSDPFEPKEVKFKPQMVKNNRAMAMAYIDARLIQDRLDEVLGVANWQDTYQFLPDGSVVCRLRLKLGDHWITKTDVGSPSEQPDSGDRVKAAVSDALKRAAVKFGIGRYLYRLPAQWVDYDPAKKQLVQLPQLPAFALPRKSRPTQPPKQAQPASPAAPKQQATAPPQKPTQSDDPVHSLDALRRLFKSKGKDWNIAIRWLSQHTGTGYDPQTTGWIADVPEGHRKLLVEAVRKMPAVTPPQQKAG